MGRPRIRRRAQGLGIGAVSLLAALTAWTSPARADPPPPAEPTPLYGEPVGPPPAPPPPPPQRSRVGAYIVIGLAGTSAVVSAVFAGLAARANSVFNQNPTVVNADTVDRNALIADVTLATTLSLGATGLVLLLIGRSQPVVAAAPGAKQGESHVRAFVTPYASPRGAGAAARITF